MDTYEKIIGPDNTIILTTRGDPFRFLNDATGSARK
jgi:hypothetical protein